AGALRWDFETLMDVSSIVGGVAGVAAPALGALRNVPGWANRVERLQGMLHIYGVTQQGSTVIVIPVQLELQLAELEKQKGQLSPGELAARRAEAILGAVRSGLMTVESAAQLVHPGDAGGTRRTWEPEPSSRPMDVEPGKTVPVEAAEARVRLRGAPGAGEGVEAPRLEEPAPVTRAPEGEARVRGDEVEVAPAGRPPAVSERVPWLESELGDLQGRVVVVAHPELKGTSTRVRYRRGRFQLEVGPDAGPFQIRTHLETARVLLRYEGPIGHIRRLLSRITQVFTHIPGYGTQGFESRLEVRKLRGIIDELEAMQRHIDERIQRLGEQEGAALGREREALQRDIEALVVQLSHHETQVDSLAAGVGFVAAYEKSTLASLGALQPELMQIRAALDQLGEQLTGLINRAADYAADGRMVGLEDWVRETAAHASVPQSRFARFGELARALGQVESMGSDERVVLRPSPPTGFEPVLERRPSQGTPAARDRGPKEREMRDSLPADKRDVFDLWAEREARAGSNLEPRLDLKSPRRMREDILEKKLKELAADLAEQETLRIHALNLTDPLHPRLAVNHEPDGNIFLHYQGKRPSGHEVQQAKDLQAYKKEELHFFGQNRLGQNYPGIDGTLGVPPRPIQLKSLPEKGKGTAYGARDAAMKALEAAKAHGYTGVEVYIRADAYDRATIIGVWDGPPTGDAPGPVGPVFEGNIISRIEIHFGNNTGMRVVQKPDGSFDFPSL
ncbi:hypothetical protein ACLESO_31700, partial [Pyxidicoccus sp. 3LG]